MSFLITDIAKKVIEKGLEKVGEGIGLGELGPPIAMFMFFKEEFDKFEEETREKARQLLNCVHIEICHGYGPEVIDRVNYCREKKGCAFRYDGIPLCHFQADFDVKKITTDVIRYDKRTHYVIMGNGDMPLRPCQKCTGHAS